MVNKQDYNNAIEQNIVMVRGDTLAFNFQLTGLGSAEAYEELSVQFSVAEHYNYDPIIEVNNDNGVTLEEYDTATDTATYSVTVTPNMTKYLDLFRYYYDLQIKDTSNVITLMRGRLTLNWEVTTQ